MNEESGGGDVSPEELTEEYTDDCFRVDQFQTVLRVDYVPSFGEAKPGKYPFLYVLPADVEDVSCDVRKTLVDSAPLVAMSTPDLLSETSNQAPPSVEGPQDALGTNTSSAQALRNSDALPLLDATLPVSAGGLWYLSVVGSTGFEYEQFNSYNLGLLNKTAGLPRPTLGGGVGGSLGPVGVDLIGDFVFSQEGIGLRDLTGLLRYEHGKWFVYGGTAWSNEPAAPGSPVDGILRPKLGGGFSLKDLDGLGALNLTVTATCALDRPWEYMGPDCLGARLGVEWRYDVAEFDPKKDRIPSLPISTEAPVEAPLAKPWYEDLASVEFDGLDSVNISDILAGEVQRLCAEVQKPNKTPEARDYAYSALRNKVGPTAIPSRCHFVAAEAAMQLGDLYDAYERYSHAIDAHETGAILEEIRQNYRLVELELTSHKNTQSVRVWDESFNEYMMPFAPSPRKALEFAEASLKLKGRFSGVLSKGKYRVEFADGTFAYFDVTADQAKQKPELRATE